MFSSPIALLVSVGQWIAIPFPAGTACVAPRFHRIVLLDLCSAAQLKEADGLRGGFGVSDPAWGKQTTADTVVCIASMTKTVTGACAMPLAEQARLSLDEPIASVFPELGNIPVPEGLAPDGNPVYCR